MRGTLQTSRRLCTDLTRLGQRRHAAHKLFLTRRIFKLSSVVCPVVRAGGHGLVCLPVVSSALTWLSEIFTDGYKHAVHL